MRAIKVLTATAALVFSMSAFGQLVFPDASQQSRAAVAFDRVIPVDADGSATQNGAALLSAIAGITDATETNQYLIELDLGTYDIGTSALNMKSYVHITGQGIGPVGAVIRGSGAVTINAADSADLNNLSILNSGNNSDVLRSVGAEHDLFGVAIRHLGTGGGSNACMSIESGALVTLTLCELSMDEGNTGGTNIGVSISGNFSTLEGWALGMGIGDPTGGSSIGVDVGAGTRCELFYSCIEPYDLNLDTGIQVASTGICEFLNLELFAGVALDNDGSVRAVSSLFNGSRVGSGTTDYYHCTDIDASAPITNSVASIP